MIGAVSKKNIDYDIFTNFMKWDKDPHLKLLQDHKLTHLFEINETTKKLLMLTKIPKEGFNEKMPFYRMFFDVSFTKEDLEKIGIALPDSMRQISGISVVDQFMHGEDEKIPKEEMEEGILFSAIIHDREKYFIEAFMVPITNLPWGKQFAPKKPYQKFMRDFVINTLHLINDPQVKLIKVERDEKRNEKRDKRGKLPIPERNIIKLTGVLKKYVDKLESQNIWHYNYRFWVRGHWRVLRNPEHWGIKVGTRIFIPPYVKGQGILIKKTYEVDVNAEKSSADQK